MRTILLAILSCSATVEAASGNGDMISAGDPIFKISPSFVGVTLDYGLQRLHPPQTTNTTSALLLNLTQHLAVLASMSPPGIQASPTILRIGGSVQDSIKFLGEGEKCPIGDEIAGYACGQGSKTFKACMTPQRFEDLCRFATRGNLQLIIGLNACEGRPTIDASMNISTLEPFLRFASESNVCKGVLTGFELGNELDLHVYHDCDGVMPAALGQDLTSLSNMVADLWPVVDTRPKLLGPDIAAFTGGTVLPSTRYLNGSSYYDVLLASMPADTLQAITFHQYVYCTQAGKSEGVDTLLDLTCLSRLTEAARILKNITAFWGARKGYRQSPELWVGESSNAWTGGLPNISDCMLDAFYYAEQFRAMSTNGVSAVIRQDLVGGYYELLDFATLKPRPSYWMAFLFKFLVGETVLAMHAPSLPSYVRSASYCSASNSGVPKLVYLFINFAVSESVPITLAGKSGAEIYTMSSQSISSKDAFLNGEPLTVMSDGSLPRPKGRTVSNKLTMPRSSILFAVVEDEQGLCKPRQRPYSV